MIPPQSCAQSTRVCWFSDWHPIKNIFSQPFIGPLDSFLCNNKNNVTTTGSSCIRRCFCYIPGSKKAPNMWVFLGSYDFCPPHLILQVTTCSLSRSRIWFLSVPSQDVGARKFGPKLENQQIALENTPWNYPPKCWICVCRSFPDSLTASWNTWKFSWSMVGLDEISILGPNKTDWTMPHTHTKTTSATTILLILHSCTTP